MRKSIPALVAVLAMLALPALAMAGDQPAATMHLEGRVVTVTPAVLTLATPDGVRQFDIAEDSRVPADLNPNEEVEVTCRPAGEGHMRITEVKRTVVPMNEGSKATSPSAAAMSQNMNESQREQQRSHQAWNESTSSAQNANLMTANGTLQSFNSEELVLDTSSGIQHFAMQPTTTRPYDLQPGDQIDVAYSNGPNDQRLVQNIDVTQHAANPQVAALAGRTELPQTGSSLPLVGLIGLVALTAAGAVRLTLRS